MKLFFTLLSIVFITTLIGCDGKERARLSLNQKVEKSDLSKSYFENVKYIPESYAETVTDTILNNGFKIKIKHFVDLNNHIEVIKKTDSLTTKYKYREQLANVTVTKNNQVIFDNLITKDFFRNFSIGYDRNELLKDKVLQSVSYEPFTHKNYVLIYFDYILPMQKERNYRFILKIKDDKEIELSNEFVIF